MGDNVYMRPFVRAAAQRGPVWLSTPWPELYEDLPVRPVQAPTTLRTQAKNIAAQPSHVWAQPPATARRVRLGYGSRELMSRSVPRALEMQLPLEGAPFVFDLPAVVPSPITEKYVIVRPPTVRREWRNEARNPLPQYVSQAARLLMRDYLVISLADLASGEEWLVGDAPPAHAYYHSGEWSFRQLLALVQGATALVGGPGWIVPMGIAARVPVIVIMGGHGGHNAPERLTDRRMDLSRVCWVMPDRFCRCADMRHRCDKRISVLEPQMRGFRDAVGI